MARNSHDIKGEESSGLPFLVDMLITGNRFCDDLWFGLCRIELELVCFKLQKNKPIEKSEIRVCKLPLSPQIFNGIIEHVLRAKPRSSSFKLKALWEVRISVPCGELERIVLNQRFVHFSSKVDDNNSFMFQLIANDDVIVPRVHAISCGN